VGPRNASEIAQKFTSPTPCKLLRICTPATVRLMLDEQHYEDDWFQDNDWMHIGASKRRVRNGRARHDLTVEVSYGMPTPRTLAVRLFNKYPLHKQRPQAFFVDMVACALLWNVAAAVRSTLVEGVRSREDAPCVFPCMACGEKFNTMYEHVLKLEARPCTHWLCAPCAVTVVESRITNVLTSDGSVREQTGCVLLKCPHPACQCTLDWAVPLVGPDFKFFLARAQKLQQTVLNPCAVCWGSTSDPDECGIAMCNLCECQTCTRCGYMAHPGVLCRTSASYLDPAVLLSEAKMQSCPSCSLATTKEGGCNHMQCKCGNHWCWACQTSIQDTNITDHYAGCSKCTVYSQTSEVNRIRKRILSRADISEEVKLFTLSLLAIQHKQEYDDL
jgi:hypothetical protein